MKQKTQFEKQQFVGWNYAHRGLHTEDKTVPENSLSAFKLSAEAGYGAELDVQLSKDGQVVVFHDDTLDRVCGISSSVGSYTLAELRSFSLFGTDEKIPLFSDVLDILKTGKGPLIVELKHGPKNEELCKKTYDILKQYPGVYCIESFNPKIVNWFRKNAPEVTRGQLASEIKDYKEQGKFLAFLLSNCFFSIFNKPHFIAYKNTKRPLHVRSLKKHGTLLFAWTSRVPDIDQKSNDGVIFEFYKPNPKY